MDFLIKIVDSLEKPDISMDGASETVRNEIKNRLDRFFSATMFFSAAT